ncbi:disease resistance protein RPV1-like [Benincasa hispida]|uniref:disease resistance protein RPV1-like n=1 Tax=Benincasa hispida TaxID=102211 RepID=UPI0019027E77|nr:disease resistance protein RPV1-like [Benincasa hispida]
MAASSSTGRRWKYDVFLSFRGEDTRGGFTDHLYQALSRKGISTFRDENEIKEGSEISLDLSAAIEASRFAIVVVSENYASSRWCLGELVKIFECQDQFGTTVLPIFYKVNPSLVRNQRGSFGDAFLKHEERFGKDEFKVQKWRQVLTNIANLKAWLPQDWSYESEVIEKICEEIWKRIKKSLTTVIEEGQLIGITSKLNQISSLLIPNSESENDVMFIGIHGMGGIGKTTVAMALYEQIHDEFEAHCFLSNIRETFKTHNLPYLQSKLLTKMFAINNNDIYDAQEGIALITKAISQKKSLLVLDDVDQLEQITGLIPITKKCCFGYGSRVIITTRNADLMSIFEAKRMFKMGELEYKEAIELLSLNAFMEKCPKECYLDHAKSIVKLVGGHPLALKVLGTCLRNKDLSVWNCVLQELQEGGNIIVHEQIFKCLKVSYDGLDEKEKVIFLDVACFFKGKARDVVEEILDGCGLYAKRRIQLLIQKSLITLSHDNKLQVHDLLQEMSWRIVRRKLVQDRFWCHKDIIKNVFQDTKADIQSIILKSTRNIVEIPPILFSRMHQLRLLNFHNVRLKKHMEYCCIIPSELRYLKWKGCPFEFLPFSSSQEYELIQLHVCHSNFKQFWQGQKHLGKLKYIKLNHSKRLLRTPDFTQVPYLERLELEGCTSLVNIHPSIFVAKRLIFLSLKDCINLTKLPSHITIEVLEVLILSGCLKLKKLPEFTGNTSRLLQLHLDNTSIASLPLSITTLTSLTMLSLNNCKRLFHIPTTIKWLVSLSHVSRPSKLENRKRKLDDVEGLEELDARETRKRRDGNDNNKDEGGCNKVRRVLLWLCRTLGSNNVFGISLVFRLQSLTKLDLKDCNLKSIPEEIEYLVSLRELNISGNNFLQFPMSISRLYNLKRLIMNRCKMLQYYPKLPPAIRKARSVDCFMVEMFPNSTKEGGSYLVNLIATD